MFKIIQKVAALVVAAYHKEAQRLHERAAATDAKITALEEQAAACLTKANAERENLLEHKTDASVASEVAVALQKLVQGK